MISRLFKRLLQYWQALSIREQRLAAMTTAIVVVSAVFMTYQNAMARISDMDTTIARLKEELLSHTMHIAHREMVEARYAVLAAQHSSEWTEEEIQDRLRQEIYRLARRVPPPLDANGMPVAMPNEHGNLVEIPSLGKGNMAEGGLGYREYMLNLRIPPSPLGNVIAFLERLQQSPQSLRIDSLELNRAHDQDLVTAIMDISRIVVNRTASPADAPPSGSADMGRIALHASEWLGAGAVAHDASGAGAHGAVEIRAVNDGGEAFLTRTLPGGATYEVIIDIAAANAPAFLGVGLEEDAAFFPGHEQVAADGAAYRYHVRFTLPGKGTPVQIRCPWIQFDQAGAAVHVSNLLLRNASEM